MAHLIRRHKNISEAPFHRRLGAFLIDFLVTLVIGLLAYMSIDAIFYVTPYGRVVSQNFQNVKKSSGLYYVVGEEEALAPYEQDINIGMNKDYYLTKVEDFYLNVQAPNSDNPLFTYRNSVYYRQEVDFDYYVMVLNKGSDDTLFLFEDNGQGYDVDFKPLVSAELRQQEWTRIYNNAIKDLENSQAYLAAREPHRNLLFVGGTLSIVIGALMPSLVIPLLFGNGQTIGKYVTGLALVNSEGYRVKNKQVVIRYFALSGLELGASIPLLVIPLFLTSAAVTVSRGAKALHDFLAGTYVVDARQSQIFENEKDENIFFDKLTTESIKSKITFFQMPPKTSKATKTSN